MKTHQFLTLLTLITSYSSTPTANEPIANDQFIKLKAQITAFEIDFNQYKLDQKEEMELIKHDMETVNIWMKVSVIAVLFMIFQTIGIVRRLNKSHTEIRKDIRFKLRAISRDLIRKRNEMEKGENQKKEKTELFDNKPLNPTK